MDFVNLLSVATHNGVYRALNGLQAGDYILSIQASEFHYCRPRKTTLLGKYTAFEVVIFDKYDNWVNPYSERLIDFRRIDDLRSTWEDDSEYAVGGYVPKDLIQDLYDYLCEKGE